MPLRGSTVRGSATHDTNLLKSFLPVGLNSNVSQSSAKFGNKTLVRACVSRSVEAATPLPLKRKQKKASAQILFGVERTA